MPTLTFEGDSHEDLVRQVRRWLLSTEHTSDRLPAAEVVERMSDLTKDALAVIAKAAPEPIAESEVMKGLTHMGYEATEQTKQAVLGTLAAVSELSGDKVIKRIENAGRAASYEMGTALAKAIIGAVRS